MLINHASKTLAQPHEPANLSEQSHKHYCIDGPTAALFVIATATILLLCTPLCISFCHANNESLNNHKKSNYRSMEEGGEAHTTHFGL